MADTGGGHRSVALALIEAASSLTCPPRVEMVDVFREHTPFPLNHIHNTYRPVVERSPGLWQAIFRLGNSERRMAQIRSVFTPIVRKGITNLYRHHRPDLVVSVHQLLNHIPCAILRQTMPGIPFATVVTDLVSVHAAWLCKEVDQLFVPTEPARAHALEAGISDKKIRVAGLPVGQKFKRRLQPGASSANGSSRAGLRAVLGAEPELPLVLLMSGGEGMGPVEQTARAIAGALHRMDGALGQIVIICGRNIRLQMTLQATLWPVPVSVQGFVRNVPEWMEAADLVVTKAGPGTISEALTMGRPLLLNGFIPGQEEGNIPYVVEHGAGVYEPSQGQIAALVARWFSPDDHTLVEMARRAKTLGRPDAASTIVGDLLSTL